MVLRVASWIGVGAAAGVIARVMVGVGGAASLRVGATAAAALGVGALLFASSDERTSEFGRVVNASTPDTLERPVSFERLERTVRISCLTAGDVHFRLRPLLRDLAADRLASHARVDLDREPQRAERLLGADLFELVRADRPRPPDQFAPGLPFRVVIGFIDRLETL
jgi:hypothetical protein